MSLEVIVPSTAASRRAWLDVLVLQNVLDRLSTDPRDSQAAEFSENLGITKAGLPSDLEYEVAQHLTLTTRLPRRGLARIGLPTPAIESARRHNGN